VEIEARSLSASSRPLTSGDNTGLGPGDTTDGTTNTNFPQPVITTLLGGDTKLCNGTLGLEGYAAVSLDGSCRDVHFSDITFSGVLVSILFEF
jgi:hypothetical protein